MKQLEHSPYLDAAAFIYKESIIGKGVFTGEKITTERMEGLAPYPEEEQTMPQLHPEAVPYVLFKTVHELEIATIRYLLQHPEVKISKEKIHMQLNRWAARHIQIAEGTETIVATEEL